MLNSLDDDNNEKQTQEQVYEFVDGDTESPSFVNAQLMCYTCGILHTSMTYCALSDNNFGLDQVLMVMLDQVLIQPDL